MGIDALEGLYKDTKGIDWELHKRKDKSNMAEDLITREDWPQK